MTTKKITGVIDGEVDHEQLANRVVWDRPNAGESDIRQ